ncbi:MAG: proline--tRNA ligase, partial [Cyanobacteria bacterium SZAS LIN-2]|nr:proline--tRNA ligase [Cyanobacteria bacterium SZAS LIN-2]
MRWSKLFVPTTRDVPAGADAVSHQLLLRAGYIRQVTAGVYALLPLAQRMRLKIMQIIREEMNAIGGQEFMLSALQPAELWKESGRWQSLDEIMFRLRDRKNAEMALGLTHEEAFTSLARTGLQSYRQLPQIWYQMQTKFRDEARPKSGLLRVREFTMKDAYSFDMDSEGLDRAFAAHYEAYKKIFIRCGLKFTAVDASSGAMGGSQSTEFMVLTEAGEDEVAICAECGYAANTEKAISRVPTHKTREGAPSELERFDTPNIKTIEQLANFPGGAPADGQIKTLVYVLDDSQSLTLI